MDFSKRMILDGAMGSMLLSYGLNPGERSDIQNLINGEAVVDIHKQYIEAGADMITANTLGAYSLIYENYDAIIKEAVKHMQTAISASGKKNILTALDMGPTGKVLEPFGDLSHEECYDAFIQSARAGCEAGVDLILIETMMDLSELKIAVQAAKTTGLPIIACMSFDKNGRTMMGDDIPKMVIEMENLDVNVIGMNCGYGPDLYVDLLPLLVKKTRLPIIVQPNAGLPVLKDGKPFYNMAPTEFAQQMTKMTGASLIGGCCGTTPAHIKEMAVLCR